MVGFSSFFRLVALDLRLGYRYMLVGVSVLSAISALLLALAYSRALSFGIDVANLTWADNIALVFGGNPPFDFRPGVLYVPPLGWILLCAVLLGMTLLYPTRGLSGWACKMVIDTGSRRAWWLAKCVWVACGSLAGIAGVSIFTLCWTMLRGQEPSLFLHARTVLLLSADIGQVLDGTWSVVPFLATIILVVVALSEMQLVLVLVVRVPFAFVTLLGFMVAGAYRQDAFLVGNALMSVRWDRLVVEGISVSASAVVAVAILVASIGMGMSLFSRWDFSSKERGE